MSLQRHNSQDVAQLICDSAPAVFKLLFGRTAIQILEQFVKGDHNRFSHRHVRVAESGGQVVGIATIVPAVELNDEADYDSILNVWAQLRRTLAHRLILDRVLEHAYPANSFYIANLAVHPAYRGRGIGTQLLLHCITEAKASGANQVFISVDINNPRAQKLYESLGFQVATTKVMPILRKTIGSRVLVLSPTNR